MGHFLFAAIGVDDGGVFQLRSEIAHNGLFVDVAQLGSFLQLLGRQCFPGLGLAGQLVDTGDDFIHIHILTSHIAVDDHRNAALFRLAIDGFKFDLSKTPH